MAFGGGLGARSLSTFTMGVAATAGGGWEIAELVWKKNLDLK